MRFLLTQPEIDRKGIGFIGHSESGMVAQIAAVNDDHVKFVIMLAAPGTDLMQLARSQERLLGLSQGASEEDIACMGPVMADVFAASPVCERRCTGSSARVADSRRARDAEGSRITAGVAGATDGE